MLFHVIAHLYAAHFKEVWLLGLHAHLNLTFTHLTALHNRFSLIEPKETEVLRDLEIALNLCDDINQESSATSDTVDMDCKETDAKTHNECSSGEYLKENTKFSI